MKKRITAVLLCAALMIMIPMISVKNNAAKDIEKVFNSKKENTFVLAEALAYEYKKEYSDETLKALALILNSNYKAGVKLKTMPKNDFIKKHGEKNYSKLENTAKEFEDKCLVYKGKAAPVPYAFVTSGKTEGNKKYPYIKNTACPWDALSKRSDESAAVSLNSINKLCGLGLSYTEALAGFADLDIMIKTAA